MPQSQRTKRPLTSKVVRKHQCQSPREVDSIRWLPMVTKAPQACTLQFQEKKEGNRGSSNLQRKKRKTMHLKGLRMLSWEKYSKLRKRWWKRTGPNKENGTFSRRLLRVVLLSNYFNSIRGKLYLWALSWTQKKILSYRFNLSKEGGTKRFPIGLKKAISKDRIY